MEENPNKTPAEPPFDEDVQWSGPDVGGPRDPTLVGETIEGTPLYLKAREQLRIQAQVRDAETALQALLESPDADSDQIMAAQKRLEEARAKGANASQATPE